MKSSDILLSLEFYHLVVSRCGEDWVSVHYEDAKVKDGVCLVFDPGRGPDFESACDDYLKKIRGKRLVFNAGTEDRHEIVVLG